MSLENVKLELVDLKIGLISFPRAKEERKVERDKVTNSLLQLNVKLNYEVAVK